MGARRPKTGEAYCFAGVGNGICLYSSSDDLRRRAYPVEMIKSNDVVVIIDSKDRSLKLLLNRNMQTYYGTFDRDKLYVRISK